MISSIFLIIFLLLITSSSSFHWDGNILYDLEANTQSDFTIEAAEWFLSSYKTTGVKSSKCGNDYVVGGVNVLGGSGMSGANPYFGQYFERAYSSVPIHNQIYIQMRFFQIDSWDLNEVSQIGYDDYFHISIDGNSFLGWKLGWRYGASQLCGSSTYPEFIFTFSLAYPHSASSLILRIIGYTNEDSANESLGFRDIKIEFLTNTSPYFSLCAPAVPSSYLSNSRCQTSCTSAGNSITPANYGVCFPSSSCSVNCTRCSDTPTTCTWCQTGWHLVGTTCYPTCDSPFSSKLLGGVTYCETPCPGQYIWWDQSCFSSCTYTTTYGSYAMVEKTTNSFLECTYQCDLNEYLYWNTSCLSLCPSPLITTTYKGRKFCEYPCGSSQYLYWNASCINSCPPPLAPEIQGTTQQRSFCWDPCQSSEYLYWNGSCINSCPSPLAPETQGTSQQRKFCWYTCSETQYLYWNGSCINSCPSPLMSETQSSSQPRNFCWYPCQSSEYLYWNGSCLNTCPSPLASEIQGTSEKRNFCWYACPESEYLYWNGSCISTCPSPLSPEKQGTSQQRNFCWYSCSDPEYLYWNGSCINTCPSPLSPETQGISSQRNFCWYPCPETQYLYWNGSCINSCPSPLAPEKQQGISSSRNFCWYSCQPSEYLYWNGSCINTCPSPLSPETQGTTQQRNFCWETCQQSEYLYWNQSCLTTCPIPLLSFDYSGNQFCFLPCAMPTIYWYQDFSCYSECNFPFNVVFHDSVSQCLKPCSKPSEHFYDLEKECHDTCDPPYIRQIINTIKVCHIDSSTLKSEIDKVKSTAEIIETLGKVTSTMLKAASIPQFSSPKPPFLTQLSALIQYVRYMRINYPWKVQLLFQENGASLISLNIDFSIPNKIQDKFDNYPLPDVFEKYSLESNFINNMWDLINTVLLVIFGILALLLLKPIFRKNFKVNHIILRILQSLRWNMPIAMISGGAGEIIFYASLQIRNTPLDSTISIISFLISLLMIFWILIILLICLKILRSFHLQRQKISPSPNTTSSSETEDWLEKLKGYEILYEEIEEKSLFSLAYMVIYVIRALLFFAIIANFYDYPLSQSILINILNLLIFVYLLYYKPLKNMWNTIQLFINEILGNILTICVLTLAIMDKAEIEARHSRVTIGNVMIVIMLIFYILGVVFLAIEGVLFLIEAHKTWKEMRARGIKNPFKIIQILLFGEAKTEHKEATNELSQISSRLNLSTIHMNLNLLHSSQNNKTIDCGEEITERRSSVISDMPLNTVSRFFLPTRRLNPTGIQITESDIQETIQNTEFEPETSQTNRRIRRPKYDENLSKERTPEENASGLVLSTSFEPPLQPNVDFIQSWGNLKARMKRFNQSIHKVHWPSEE